MVEIRIKSMLKLLLVIIMAAQPVIFSSAMAGMGFGHHMTSPADGHAGKPAMKGGMANPHHQGAHQDGGGLGKCCQSAACSSVSVVSVAAVACETTSQCIVSAVIPLKSTDLPAEIKPPRNLLG